MALLVPPNVTVSIYRGSDPSSPYSLGSLVVSAKGYLKPVAPSGRFGSASWLNGTHVLLLAPTSDVRDAYNTQLDPSRDNTKADTVILLDSGGSNKTAYYAVFVEQVSRGTPAAHLRVYLDRFQPNAWPN